MHYEYYLTTPYYGGWGLGWNFGLDADVGYNALITYLYANVDNLVFNPTLYLEVASHSYMDIILPFATYRFKLDMVGFKYTIASYSFMVQLHSLTNYCYGMQWM